MTQQIITFLALLTLVTNIFFAVHILLFLLSRFNKKFDKILKNTQKVLSVNTVKYALTVTLTATLGSLYFSEIAGFEPCKLCWLQRIFMYPLPIILGTSLWSETKDSFRYILPLATIGAVIAGYHYYFQITGNPLIPCSTVGFSVSCSERFFTYYGYITIPWMSLSAFVYVILLGLVSKKIS